jgi:hypothetical protein
MMPSFSIWHGLAGLMLSAALVWLLFAVVVAIAANARGRGPAGWALLGLLFGPFALVAVLVMPRNLSRTHTSCPACAEPVRREAVVCYHCGAKLTPAAALAIATPSEAERARNADIIRRGERWILALAGGAILAFLIIAASL